MFLRVPQYLRVDANPAVVQIPRVHPQPITLGCIRLVPLWLRAPSAELLRVSVRRWEAHFACFILPRSHLGPPGIQIFDIDSDDAFVKPGDVTFMSPWFSGRLGLLYLQ